MWEQKRYLHKLRYYYLHISFDNPSCSTNIFPHKWFREHEVGRHCAEIWSRTSAGTTLPVKIRHLFVFQITLSISDFEFVMRHDLHVRFNETYTRDVDNVCIQAMKYIVVRIYVYILSLILLLFSPLYQPLSLYECPILCSRKIVSKVCLSWWIKLIWFGMKLRYN